MSTELLVALGVYLQSRELLQHMQNHHIKVIGCTVNYPFPLPCSPDGHSTTTELQSVEIKCQEWQHPQLSVQRPFTYRMGSVGN